MNKEEINNIYQKTVEAGNDWADKDAAASLLEEARKTLLSELTLRHKEGRSNVDAENMARAELEYINYIKKMVEARRLANRARVVYDQRKSWIDMKRSVEATKRQEQRMLNEQV